MSAKQVDFQSLFGEKAYLRLMAFSELIIAWNRKIALTSVSDDEIFPKLVAPSAWLGLSYANEDIGEVADFGSGPGIPGIPMAIVDERNSYVLVESIGKKSEFQRYCISALDLDRKKARPLNIRLAKGTKMSPVNRIVSRAAGEMLETLELWKGKTNEGAVADFFKGTDAAGEFERLSTKYPEARMETLETPEWFDNLVVVRISGAL